MMTNYSKMYIVLYIVPIKNNKRINYETLNSVFFRFFLLVFVRTRYCCCCWFRFWILWERGVDNGVRQSWWRDIGMKFNFKSARGTNRRKIINNNVSSARWNNFQKIWRVRGAGYFERGRSHTTTHARERAGLYTINFFSFSIISRE
jgi:hypothetical protein